MCIVSAFTAPFSQLLSKAELKTELAKGCYESPYFVRPLNEITVNGVAVDEYSVAAPQGALYSNAAETLCNELYKACGKRIAVAENAAA